MDTEYSKTYADHQNRQRCHYAGKICYSHQASAETHLKTLQEKGRTQLKRAYRCPHCKFWHLTSDQNRKKRVRQRERFNDGEIPARRVSKHEDGPGFRRSMEDAWVKMLGWDSGA